MSSDPIDPLVERRLRLEQAEREAKGDFSHPAPTAVLPPKAAAAASANTTQESDDWKKYKVDRDNDDDEGNPNKILNKQHNNLRAQAKIDLAMRDLLDTSIPRQDR